MRREQILAAAADLARAEGLHGLSMKRVAQIIGISEALIYTYFQSPLQLMIVLAQIEIVDMEKSQELEVAKHIDYADRARASADGYLRYVERRGGLLQILLGSPEVRAALRDHYLERRVWGARSMTRSISQDYDLDLTLAGAGTAILRAVPVRAGRLLGAGEISLEMAQQMTRAIADGARARLIHVSRKSS